MRAALVVVTICVLWAVLDNGFVGDLFVNFRLQYLLLLSVVVPTLFYLRDYRWAGMGVLVLLEQAWALGPWLATADAAPTSDQRLRLVCANVQRENEDRERLGRWIRAQQIDIVALLEVDEPWLAELVPFLNEFPHRFFEPRSSRFGVAVASRYPLTQQRLLQLGSAGLTTLSMQVQSPQGPLNLIATHPPPPMVPEFFNHRNDQLRDLAREARRMEPGPTVLAGDLNTTPYSRHLLRLEEEAGLRNVRRGQGLLASWPSALPGALRIPLDHLLVSPQIRASVRLGPRIGSDHLPVVADLAW
jgi:endonuclease/exonuclease/phosphatase (EEP) superfamily protein YafD